MLFQHLDLQIAVVDGGLGFAVEALEADGAGAGVVFEGFFEFVGSEVGLLDGSPVGWLLGALIGFLVGLGLGIKDGAIHF